MEEIQQKEQTEFNILGFKLAYKPEKENPWLKEGSALKIVSNVQQEADNLRKMYPQLKNEQLCLLVALKMAEEKEIQWQKFSLQADEIEGTARSALAQLQAALDKIH
jgi:D-arabinose 1-dehydrogenase-like Zn-dependent alcohol dehydrogenase